MYFTLGNEVYHVLEHKQFVDLAYLQQCLWLNLTEPHMS